jgi:ribosomal protein S1
MTEIKSLCFGTGFTPLVFYNPRINHCLQHSASSSSDTTLQKSSNEKGIVSQSRRKNNKKRNYSDKQKKIKKERPNTFETIHPLTDLKLGSTVEGWVAAFTDFGVFVKIPYDLKNKGGQAGYALLHKSQISDEEITPSGLKKMFRIGQVLKNLRVITINYAKGEVGLSTRKQREKRKDLSHFTVGKEYTGKVVNVMAYGAFVDIGAKANVLLHISRVSPKKIENIRHYLNEGDAVQVRIIGKDEKKQTMAASMLEYDADLYLDRRSAQLNRVKNRAERKASDEIAEAMKMDLKSELEYFEDAVRELEDSLSKS